MPASHPFSDEAIARVRAAEVAHFTTARPRSAALAHEARAHFLSGVPMHWMADWPSPFPLFVKEAEGARIVDVDGHAYVDFCLGDTGAMFGHSPEPVAAALRSQASRGYTTMLPSEDAVWIGRELARRFGLAVWQVATTATDANRFALRWARAVTGRKAIVVFDGCYHGTVDETMVRLKDGRTVARSGGLGAAYDPTDGPTRVVEFNDLAGLEAALAPGDVAAVLTEPALTNIGMVLPQAGFHEALRELTRRFGTLLIIDETHTISTGPGGWTRAFGLEPDMFVLGKPIAGGIPASVYGMTEEVARRAAEARAKASASTGGEHGHSGMGTTLSANQLCLKAMRANLEQVMTEDAYRYMITLSERLAAGLRSVFARHGVAWSVTQIGSRCEFQFRATPPLTGREAEAAFDADMEGCLHLFLLNRGILITPFHNMTLVSSSTSAADVDRLIAGVDECLTTLSEVGQ